MIRFLPFVVLFGFIAWIVFQADVGQSNILFRLADAVPFGDKIGHCVLFGLLSLFANIALGFRHIISLGKLAQWGSIIVLAIALIEEGSQAFIPRRGFDLLDGAADVLGVFLATLISVRVSEGKKLTRPTESKNK